MTDCTLNQTTPRSGTIKTMFMYFKTRVQQYQNRAAFQHMLKLPPCILKDIGVSRGDIIWANNLPIEENAAVELEKIARRRGV